MSTKAVVCNRANLSCVAVMLVSAFLGMLALALDASHPVSGQSWQLNNYCPQGARQVPYGGTYTCVCPDGSYATYGVPCRQAYQQPSGVQCNTGSYCPTGTTCCGNQCCNAGSYCSRTGGCIPQGASDCGNGQFCRDGRSCWTSPVNVPGVLSRGELKCVTGDQREALDAAVAQQRREEQQQKEAAEAERKRKDEERKEEARQKQEAARQAELKRKADADAKKAEDKRQELARQDAKRKQDEASGRQKVSDILKKDLEKQRQADLQKTADQQRQELARFQAEFGKPKTAECHLMIIAYGRNDPKTQACLLKEQQNTRQPADVPVQPASPTSAQLEYLRRNATSLKPEQRTITVAPAPAGQPARYAQPSTFSSKTPDSKSASTSADPSCPDPKNIDKNRASEALPYALISNDSYNNEASLSVPAAGFVRTQNWETTMRDGGVSEPKIRDYKAAGFFAASYSNSTTGETVISYRGTDQLRDFTTNAEARFAPNLWHLQYIPVPLVTAQSPVT